MVISVIEDSSTGTQRMLSKRRDKLRILEEILETAKQGVLKTQVMYKVNMSFTQLNQYLSFLLRVGLLEKVERGNALVYRTTSKGRDFVQRYRGIRQLLKVMVHKNKPATEPQQV
jgi:predicted transcriptional regulator